MYSPARTLFVTSVDQSRQAFDVGDYLEKGASPPDFPPQADDFGLIPLPFTATEHSKAYSYELEFLKLVVLGVPHAGQS